MLPTADITLTPRRTAFAAMPGFSKLFADYCENFERLSDFYAGPFADLTRYKAEAKRVLSYDRDRSLVADVLMSQNDRWGLDETTRANVEALAGPESLAVVTGQQVGLLTGPLYTIYKTATAVKLARRLSDGIGVPVVPVFWLEGEDHDIDEIKSVRLLRGNDVVTVAYPFEDPPAGSNHGPVGRIRLAEAIDVVLNQIEEILPPTDFRPEVMRLVREAYRPGYSLRDAFAQLLKSLFRNDGLVFISPDDRRLKEPAVRLFEKEVNDARKVANMVSAAGVSLARDYHAQLSVRPTNLFHVDKLGRFSIDLDNGHFRIRGREGTLDRDALIAMIREDPCCISPNVVLRPILQDRILPTLAYVAGPSEIAYLAQLKRVYEWADQPMPLVYPRASVTLVESKIERLLSQYALDVVAAGENVNDLFRRVVIEQMDVDVPEAFGKAGGYLHAALDEIKPIAGGVDKTLGKAVEAARASILNEWKRLQEKVLKSEKRRHDEDRARLGRLQANLYPDGRLQERGLSVLYFLNKYGPGFVEQLTSAIDLDTREHQVISLQSS